MDLNLTTKFHQLTSSMVFFLNFNKHNIRYIRIIKLRNYSIRFFKLIYAIIAQTNLFALIHCTIVAQILEKNNSVIVNFRPQQLITFTSHFNKFTNVTHLNR